MIKIITTVGSSIITNYMNNDVEKALHDSGLRDYSVSSEYYQLLKNPKLEDRSIGKTIEKYFLFNMEKEEIYNDGEFGDDEIVISWKYNAQQQTTNLHCSAEVYSISEIIKNKPDETYEVVLITTDTIISRISADLIEKVLKKIQSISNISINRIEYLQVDNGKSLKNEGFNKLINCFDELIKNDINNKVKAEYIFNITGGYKGIIPLITIYALITNIKINYIYENSKSLVEFGNIPLTFDWSVAEIAGPYLDNKWIHYYKKDHKVVDLLQNYGFVDKSFKITPLGNLFKNHIDQKYPEGKETLGMLVEYKLLEYYTYRDKEVRDKYKVSRSILINDIPIEGMKGNEIDILLELKDNCLVFDNIWEKGNKHNVIPMSQKYITTEIKGFFQVKSGDKAKTQFRAFLNNIEKYWNGSIPLEIRYITWQLLKEGINSNAEIQIKDTLKDMQGMVKDKFGRSVLFKAYLLTIPIDLKTKSSNVYTNMMQKKITNKDIKLIQL